MRVRIARACEITPGAVNQWDKVPAERVLIVEEVMGVSRYELRPDIYGAAPQEAA